MYTVYMHITPSNKRYIGITQDITTRWNHNGYAYHKQIFGRAIKKYGWDNIQHIIIMDNLSKEWACQLEKLYIAKYNTMNPKYGYNQSAGGDGNPCPVSEETKEKIRKANRGQKRSAEFCRKISESHKGIIFSETHKANLRKAKLQQSEETRRKISEAHKKENLSDETRRKLSESAKGRKFSDITKEKLRQANLGKRHSEETKQKMREAHLGKKYKKRVYKSS